jgi:hypothetical protein
MKSRGAQIARGLVNSFWFVFCTFIYVVPIGFHHMHFVGVTAFITLNGEDPRPGTPRWGEFEFHFFPERLVLAIVLWIFTLFVVFRWLKYLDSKSYVA